MDDARHLADERRAWIVLAGAGIAAATILAALGFSVRVASLGAPLGGGVLLALVALFYRVRRPNPRLAATCTALAQLVLFTLAAGPLSYAAATLDRPLQDGLFAGADRLLGLDWRALVDAVAARPWTGALLKLVYDTLMPQLALVLVVLGFSGRLTALRMLVWAAGLAGLAAVAVSALLPAVGYYAHLHLAAASYVGLDPSAAFIHLHDIEGLRDGTLRRIDIATLQGIITFPSFHAALAVLFAWGLWQNRWTRWPGLALEALMMIATPVHGGHYFVDVIAGVALAAGSLAAAARIVAGRAVAIRSSPSRRSHAASAP